MNQVFFEILDKNFIVYLFGILILTKIEAEHKSILSEVFHCLAQYLPFIKQSKYTLSAIGRVPGSCCNF